MPQRWELCQKEVGMGKNFHNYGFNLMVNHVSCLFLKFLYSLGRVMVNFICQLEWPRGAQIK